MKEQHKTYLIGALLLIFVAGIGFLGGLAIQKFRLSRFLIMRPGMMTGYGQRQFGMRAGFRGANHIKRNGTSGQITSISGNQLIIKLPNGTTTTVTIFPSTQYLQTSPATQNNLKPGENISVSGQSDQNGTISAQIVNINSQQPAQ